MKKLNNLGFTPLVVIAIIVVIAALGVGGYFVLKSRIDVALNPSPTASQTSASILSFSIEPSRKDGSWLMYGTGAKAILVGKNITSVSVTQCPTGTGVAYCPSVGAMVKVKANSNSDTWELVLPANLLTTSFYAIATDATGAKINGPDLGNVGYQQENQPDSWKTYINTKYEFELKYPDNYQILGNCMGGEGKESTCESIFIQSMNIDLAKIKDPTNGFVDVNRFKVDVIWNAGQGAKDFKSLATSEYASNKGIYATSDLMKITFLGDSAYEFSLNHGYKSSRGGSFLTYPEQTVILLQHDGNIFRLMFAKNDKVFEQMLSTFRFTK